MTRVKLQIGRGPMESWEKAVSLCTVHSSVAPQAISVQNTVDPPNQGSPQTSKDLKWRRTEFSRSKNFSGNRQGHM